MESTGLLPRSEHSTVRAEMRASQHARLLAAVADQVAEHGYAATSVARIARAAGVSTRAFYEHFADKEACLLAAYEVAITTAVERLSAADEPSLPWRDRLEALMRAWFALLAAEPSVTHLYALDIWHATPATQRRAVEGTATLVSVFRRCSQEARTDEPRVLPVTEDELQMLAGGTHRLMLLRVLAGETDRLGELVPTVVATAISILTRTAR